MPELAADLRARFTRDPEYAARWAALPAGSRPLANPRGGAPGFAIQNVYVLPGLPAEMEAMFDAIADEFRSGAPIGVWRRTYSTRESDIIPPIDTTLTIKSAGKPVAVKVVGDGTALKFATADGVVSVELPAEKRTKLVDVVEVDFASPAAAAGE